MFKSQFRERNRKLILLSGCFLITAALVGMFITLPVMDNGQTMLCSLREGSLFTLREQRAKNIVPAPPPASVEAVYSRMDVEMLSLNVPPFTGAHRPGYDLSDFTFAPDIPLSYDLQEYTYDRCESLNLEYEMVLAIMWRESQFLPQVVGTNKNGTQDSGLMQINDINREWLKEKHGINDLLDPYQNIDAGTIILSHYFAKYSENQALMAYQYGEEGMLRRWESGMRTNALTRMAQEKRDEYRQMRLNI